MIKKLNIGNHTFKLIWRHQWDKQDNYDKFDKWKEKKLGIWWKFYSNSTTPTTEIKSKLSKFDGVMLGVNLIWLNIWIDFGKTIKFRKSTFKYKRKL